MNLKQFLLSNQITPNNVGITKPIWNEIMEENRIPTVRALEQIIVYLGGESQTKRNIIRYLLWESIKETQSLSKTMNLVLHIKPMAAPRPRFSFNRTYMPQTYTQWKKQVGVLMEPFGRIVGPCSIDVEYHHKAPSGTTWGYHTRTKDIDNMDKSLLDALQDCEFIDNDKNVHTLNSQKVYSWQNAIIITLKYNDIWDK
tara:strand:+ start:399 stop:995 length:597 start_codon:yes stop_codon:yes gene_type:complete